MKNEDGSIDNELCYQCKDFDRSMNGGAISFDVYVHCNHDRNKNKYMNEDLKKLQSDWDKLTKDRDDPKSTLLERCPSCASVMIKSTSMGDHWICPYCTSMIPE
jgi:hypothetical protein